MTSTAALTLTSHLGNHDITLDADFYAQHGLSFHNQHPQDPDDCLKLLKSSPTITYLNHESAVIKLSGPRTTFKVFGSPYSPADGLWAFGYDSTEQASRLWNQIPMDTDVVVTHAPPKHHCDENKDRRSAGCEILRQTLWRVRPRLSVCGHVHEGRGSERVLWDLHDPKVKYKESDTKYWIDPGHDNKKQSLIDLTSRGGTPLDYKIIEGDEPPPVTLQRPQSGMTWRSSRVDEALMPFKSNGYQTSWGASSVSPGNETNALACSPTDPEFTELASSNQPTVFGSPFGIGEADSSTRGQGGVPSSGHCDMEALSGRMGRKETCVINAAIKASSWSPKSSVAKRFNKPTVVDVDLPVWMADAISG